MKILAICGSPRKGNTEAMLKRILDGAMEHGANAELVLLREKKIELCDGCNKCSETKSCHVLDDMNQLYPKIFAADVLVLGSPTYFNNVSGTMKNFFDRISPYWESGLKGKKAVIVVCGAAGKESIKHAEDAIKQFCEICGIKIVGRVSAKLEKPEDAAKDEKLMKKCFVLGKKIVQ